MASIPLQKANFWKRISAWLLDFILLTIVATGLAAVVSAVLNYDGVFATYSAKIESYYDEYESKYGIDLNITEEQYNALSPEEKTTFDAVAKEASNALAADVEAQRLYQMLYNLTIVIVAISLFFSCLILYFIVPLFFSHGQTLGKKIFGLAVMRTNCVKASNPVLFIRAMIGLYAMETMVPVLMILMIYFGMLGLTGVIVLLLLFVLQVGVLIATKTNSSIHDLLTDTVVIDFASQEVFDTEEDLIARKQQLHEEEVAQSEYDRLGNTPQPTTFDGAK